MAARGWGIIPKTILPTIAVSAVIAVAVGFVLYYDQKSVVLLQSRKTAISIAQQTLAERAAYTAQVVNPLLRDFGGPEQGFSGNGTIRWVASKNHNPKEKGLLPLPAALVHFVSANVNSKGSKSHSLELLSLDAVNPEKNPNTRGGTAQEIAAMRYLQAQKNPLAFREVQVGDGDDATYILWYSDIASVDACVDCHNVLGGGHKDDWVVGDVMGSIKVTLPLGKELDAAKASAIRIVGIVMGAFAVVALLTLLLLWLVVNRPLIRSLGELQKAADRISMGEVDQPVKIQGADEVGRLGQSFERMRTSLQTLIDDAEKRV
jgi:protein-histidine pros-kinase